LELRLKNNIISHMPQINLNAPKGKKKTGDDKAASPKAAPLSNPWSNPSPWGDDFGDFLGDRNDSQSARMSPQERVAMIERVYEEVLGRKPDTRDVNYYKYSTLSENEIRGQLLAGKEHKQLVEDGREFKKMRERATQAETKIKMLEAQNQDQIEEFKHLTKLLKEKNVYIQELREKLKNPYNIIESTPLESAQPQAAQTTPSSLVTPDSRVSNIFTSPNGADTTDKAPSVIDRIRGIISP
jgi:hypothetical protein